MSELKKNSVKPRYDGKGDAWALHHREGLGPTFNMSDVDALFGAVFFGQNTGEKLFLEYVPDSYENRTKKMRRFAYVSMFDRKASLKYAVCPKNTLCTAFYLDMCRRLGADQPINPKFFYVIGNEKPPWEMMEVDLHSGNLMDNKATINQKESRVEWEKVWRKLGLTDLRRELKNWIDP